MSNTENYIILKPIAERFSRIAKEITDNEIKDLIKSELREQIRGCDFGLDIREIMDDFFEDDSNVENIKSTIENSIKRKFD